METFDELNSNSTQKLQSYSRLPILFFGTYIIGIIQFFNLINLFFVCNLNVGQISDLYNFILQQSHCYSETSSKTSFKESEICLKSRAEIVQLLHITNIWLLFFGPANEQN